MILDLENLYARICEALQTDVVAEIADIVGLRKQSIYLWQKNNWPSLENLGVIAETSNTSLHWLLTGQGEKFVNLSAQSGVQATPAPAPSLIPFARSGWIKLPLVKNYELTAAALSAKKPVSEASAMIDPSLLRNRSADDVITFIIANDDFEMDGYRRNRDLTVVPATAAELQANDECVLWLDNRFIIRLFQDRQADVICLRHFQRLTPPIYVRADEITVLYRVVG